MFRSIARYSALLLMVTLTHVARAQTTADPERVLVPVSVGNVPGAYGTSWSTELWFRNNGTTPVAVVPLAIADYIPAPGRTVFLPVGYFPAASPGTVLFVSREGSENVQFDLRLFNRASSAEARGIRIPVVRESQFRQRVTLLNVPAGSAFRSALRIYSLDDTADGEIARVRIYSYDEELLASADLPMQGRPLYAQLLSLADSFPNLTQVPRVRIDVESASGTTTLWAFVTAVSNATQEVEVVVPD